MVNEFQFLVETILDHIILISRLNFELLENQRVNTKKKCKIIIFMH